MKWKRPRLKKISYKLTLAVVGVIILIFTTSTILEIQRDRAIHHAELTDKVLVLSDMIKTSMSTPLWNIDYENVESVAESYFNDKEVIGLQVRDDFSGVIYSRFVDQFDLEKTERYTSRGLIYYQEELVGTYELFLTDAVRSERIVASIVSRLAELVIFIVIVALLIAWIMDRMTHPLKLLEEDVTRLAEGKERLGSRDYRDDEIGLLAANFNLMGDKIEASQKALRVLNESLEERILNRTMDLEAKNRELNIAMEQLRETQEQLVLASKLKLTSQLVAGVAHEINTPLGNTITLVTYLADRLQVLKTALNGDRVSKQKMDLLVDDVTSSTRGLERNLTLVSQLVNHFKQLTMEHQAKDRVAFNLHGYTGEVYDNLMIEWMDDRVTVDLDMPKDLMLNSFPSAFLEVYTHLTINAVEHGFKGLDRGTIRLRAEVDGNDLYLEFSDDGLGMDRAELDVIFTPFYKTNLLSKGSGLGLSIVENVVSNQLGGSISCVSTPGEGTTFYIHVANIVVN